MVGTVETVTGPIASVDLGPVLPMEHLLGDFTAAAAHRSVHCGQPATPSADTSADASFYDRPVDLEILGDLALGRGNREDLTLADAQLATAELHAFAANGGAAVVEATSHGLGRDPAALKHLSRQTGVPIVMGSAWYHPQLCPQIASRGAADLAEEIIADLTEGVDGASAGIIGRLGGLDPAEDADARLLSAAAQASTATDTPILIDHREAPAARSAALRALLDAGVDAGRIAVAGLAELIAHPRELERLARAGFFLLFDQIGMTPNVYRPWDHLGLAGTLAHLIQSGHLERLLISHGLCRKSHFEAYGGPGLGFIARDFATVLGFFSIQADQVARMTTGNPLRLLSRTPPGWGGPNTHGKGARS